VVCRHKTERRKKRAYRYFYGEGRGTSPRLSGREKGKKEGKENGLPLVHK